MSEIIKDLKKLKDFIEKPGEGEPRIFIPYDGELYEILDIDKFKELMAGEGGNK